MIGLAPIGSSQLLPSKGEDCSGPVIPVALFLSNLPVHLWEGNR